MLHLRYDGTDTTIPVAFSDFDFGARTAFEAAHKAQFGFVYENDHHHRSVERSKASTARKAGIEPERAQETTRRAPRDGETRPVYHRWQMARCRIVRRDGSARRPSRGRR
jgi:5-oxoprolinase (ATP-hydrolysing)